MRLKTLVVAFVCAAFAGCSNLPSRSLSGTCTVIQRSMFHDRISVQTSKILDFDVLFEFPAAHFYGIRLLAPSDLARPPSAAMYMAYRGRDTKEGCKSVHDNERYCSIVPSEMRSSGFMLSMTLAPDVADEAALQRMREHWTRDLSCPVTAPTAS